MRLVLFAASLLLIGCLNTANRHPYRHNEAASVKSSVAPTSSLISPPCAKCIEYENELRELRWLLDESDEPDLSEPF